MILAFKIVCILLQLVWLYLWLCYCVYANENVRPLKYWQWIDFHFYGVFARGLKGLDILVKTWMLCSGAYLIYWLWQLF